VAGREIILRESRGVPPSEESSVANLFTL
jgi:hypothetical protein